MCACVCVCVLAVVTGARSHRRHADLRTTGRSVRVRAACVLGGMCNYYYYYFNHNDNLYGAQVQPVIWVRVCGFAQLI